MSRIVFPSVGFVGALGLQPLSSGAPLLGCGEASPLLRGAGHGLPTACVTWKQGEAELGGEDVTYFV